MWMAAIRLARAGGFATEDQELFRRVFGDMRFEKFKGFVSGQSQAQLTLAAEARAREAVDRLRAMIPRGAESRIDECEVIARQFAKV
jgi:hypothetical protein